MHNERLLQGLTIEIAGFDAFLLFSHIRFKLKTIQSQIKSPRRSSEMEVDGNTCCIGAVFEVDLGSKSTRLPRNSMRKMTILISMKRLIVIVVNFPIPGSRQSNGDESVFKSSLRFFKNFKIKLNKVEDW